MRELSPREIDLIFEIFDVSGDGVIHADEIFSDTEK